MACASPSDFISLIKYADCVFTDSFHCTAFSNIYQKNFFVFPRDKKREMESRISSLTSLFGEENHFCNTEEKQTMSYVSSTASVDFEKQRRQYDVAKEKSRRFLHESLEDENRKKPDSKNGIRRTYL